MFSSRPRPAKIEGAYYPVSRRCTQVIVSGTYVNDSVDTRPLLQCLGAGTDQKAVEQRPGSEEALVFEASNPEVDIVVSVALLGCLTLHKAFRLQSKELGLDSGVVGGKGTKIGEGHQTRIFTALEHQPTGAEWQETDSNAENGCRNELQTKRKTPSSLALRGTGTPNEVLMCQLACNQT